jgi:chromosomal replication initiation ATPase DnaA
MTKLSIIETEVWMLHEMGHKPAEINRLLKLDIADASVSRIISRVGEKMGLSTEARWRQPEAPRPTVRAIIEDVAREHRVNVDELLSKSHRRPLVHMRWEAMYRARVETGRSYPEIARVFGLDHSTVHHGVRKFASMRKAAE